MVVTVEDNSRTGGIGDAVAAALRDAEIDIVVRTFGIAPRFLDHAPRASVLAGLGLTAQDVSRAVVETVARIDVGRDDDHESPVVIDAADDSTD
jgi:1-deoxy-D-xylulose-5-phosphate synthase